MDDIYKAGNADINADTQSHAVLSFEVKSKRSLVKLRHQIKHDKAFSYACRHKGLTAASDWKKKLACLSPLVTQTTLHVNLNTYLGVWPLQVLQQRLLYSEPLRRLMATINEKCSYPLTLTRFSSQCVDHVSIDRSLNLCDPVGLNGQTWLALTLHNEKDSIHTVSSLLGTPGENYYRLTQQSCCSSSLREGDNHFC